MQRIYYSVQLKLRHDTLISSNYLSVWKIDVLFVVHGDLLKKKSHSLAFKFNSSVI